MINPLYTDPEVLNAIRAAWRADRSVALKSFLDDEELKTTVRAYGRGWKRAYIPDRHSHETHTRRLPRIAATVKAITGRFPLSESSRRFSHRDYTILHDQDAQRPGIVALLFLEDWDEEWGGYIAFVKHGKTLLKFTPRRNTLLIFERKDGVRYFVKYINHRAGRRRLTAISP